MAQLALALAYALFVWWFTTGLVLYMVRLPQRTFRWSMLGASVLLLLSLYGLRVGHRADTATDAYLAFTWAILVWGWAEVGFLTGFVTGPRKSPCPPGCSMRERAGHAFQAIVHHEIALLVLGLAILFVTWGADNQAGFWTFGLLWVMRLSAKLNLFLGVPILNAEFLPAHLRFLESFFAKRSLNLLFPVAVTASTIGVVVLVRQALDDGAGIHEAAAAALLAALLALAVLEHWFMVLPAPLAELWSWGLRSRAIRAANDRGIDTDATPLASASLHKLLPSSHPGRS
jgi:putative photosynthetic complex assembly protein 2